MQIFTFANKLLELIQGFTVYELFKIAWISGGTESQNTSKRNPRRISQENEKATRKTKDDQNHTARFNQRQSETRYLKSSTKVE